MKQIHHLFTLIFAFNLNNVKAYPLFSGISKESVAAHLNLDSFYVTIIVLLGLSATFLAGCLCCKRKKGFQEFSPRTRNNARGNIEFSNPLSTVNTQSEITLFPPSGSTPITFDPLPPLTPKHQQVPAPNPRPAAFTDALTKGISVQAWFEEPQDNFPRQQLHYLRECGRGWFGRVVEGEARGILPNGRTSRVIVRILREGATESEQKFFLHEARPYMELNHPNILRLLGKCLENDPFLLLFEACNGGDLKSWLSQNVASRETLTQQGITMRMAADIASGLAHMNRHGFVHTDLAARNVLVTSDLRVKVGDYGTSFETFKDDYYCLDVVALPIRWCAPESLLCTDTTIETKEVTAPANVWSFGVVLWEICEFGKLPYTDLSDDQVIVQVLGNERVRLPEPSFPSPFKTHLYYLMQLCWRSHKERPSISHILSMLNHLLTSKIKTPNDMDDFERRWENMKPNTVPKMDNHTPTTSEDRVKSDNDSGVVLDNKHSAFAGSEMDLSSKKLLAESSSSMTISPQLSVTSSSGGEFFSQASSPIKLKSPSLQNLQGSLEDINEGVDIPEHSAGLDLWLQNIEIKDEKDAKLVSGVYKAINDLDTALSLEKTSSSNESSYDSPSTNRKSSTISNQNPVPEFKLGPFVNSNFQMDRRLKFPPDSFQDDSLIMRRTGDSSGTDTEDEIWRRRIERGEFSEKVKEKSKSIADLMVLTHIDNSDGSESDSLPSFSYNKMVRQNTKTNAMASSIGFGSDKCIYSSLTAEQSDSDLKKFQNALKKKDMDDPSLNFLRRDSLSYFINNPNFKFSDSSSNNSFNLHQTDHFLEIRASEKTNSLLKVVSEPLNKESVTPLKSTPEIQVSSCGDLVPSEEPSVPLNVTRPKFKFVFKEEEEEGESTVCPASATRLTDSSVSSSPVDTNISVKRISENHSNSDVVPEVPPVLTAAVNENETVNQVVMSISREQDEEIVSSKAGIAKEESTAIINHTEFSNGTNALRKSDNNFNPIAKESCPTTISNAVMIGGSAEQKINDNNQLDTNNFINSESHLNSASWKIESSVKKENVLDSLQEESKNSLSQWSCEENRETERKMINFELGDSGIIIDEPSESMQFILPISSETDAESAVILGSCEDFTLDLYKGLKTSSGDELITAQENEEEIESNTVLEWNRKNQLNEESSREKSQLVKNDDSVRNCDSVFIETVDNCDFVPESKDDYTYNRFYEDHSDDTYIDSGKSSDVLEDDNYELRPYTSYSNLADPSHFSQEYRVNDDCSNESQLWSSKGVDQANFICNSGASNEDLALKLLTPDDEKSSDTGFRDKSSPTESNEDMCNDRYNLEDIENELEDSHETSCSGCPELLTDIERKSGDLMKSSEIGPVSRNIEKDGLSKKDNSNLPEEGPKFAKNGLQGKLDVNTISCFNDESEVSLEALEKEGSGTTPQTVIMEENVANNGIDDARDNEKPPPSYEEYERLHGKFRPYRLNHLDLMDSGGCSPTNEDDRLRLSLERCHSPSSTDSDEGHRDEIYEGGMEGWYLHSNSPQTDSLRSSWLPESITDDNNRSEAVKEEYLMAIRNELNEKLLKMHLPGLSLEKEEETTEDDLIICDDSESRKRSRKAPDIFIQYNNFSDYLSPIAEEDENECSSMSSSISDSSELSKTLSLNENKDEEEVFDSKSFSHDNQGWQESEGFIEVNTETNEIRLIGSPRPSSQQSAVSHSEEPTTDQLESLDQCSEYSVDSISPLTGSPSATNPNATFSSLNENLSEVFLSPNSVQSDLTFADDKTICSGSDQDCETDVEEVGESLSSPGIETEVISSSRGNSSPGNKETGPLKSLKDLSLNPSGSDNNGEGLKVAAGNPVTDDSSTPDLLPSREVVPVKCSSSSNAFEAFNGPKPPTPIPLSAECNNTKLNEADSLVRNFPNTNSVTEIKSNTAEHSTDTQTSEAPSLSPTLKNQVDLRSTLAFENPELATDKKTCTNGQSSSLSGSSSTDTDCDSAETYKNYCRKKFKITKVDENLKPVSSREFGKRPNDLKCSPKMIVDDNELNRRLNEINMEAQGRLEMSVESNQVSKPMPSPCEQNGISFPSSWPVSSQLSQVKNLEKLGPSQVDTSDDQMMSTSFIDSNSTENSDTEGNLDSDGNWEEENSEKKPKATFDDGDFWCENSELSVPLNRIVEEDGKDEKDDDYDDEDDEDTTDFVPSSWNSQATPIKSVLKSPETRSDQKKSVSFKRQRYHCVYEYPKEEHSEEEEEVPHSRFSPLISFDFSEYTDWEMGITDDGLAVDTPHESETVVCKPNEKHNVYALTPIDKDFSFNSSLEDDEFFISSSTRPFKNDQGSLNSQFFPGKTYLEENFTPLAADIGEENKIEK